MDHTVELAEWRDAGTGSTGVGGKGSIGKRGQARCRSTIPFAIELGGGLKPFGTRRHTENLE